MSGSTQKAEELWALPDAEYNHRITELRKKLCTLSSQPNEWMQAIFTQWLGIQTPHVWQVETPSTFVKDWTSLSWQKQVVGNQHLCSHT